MDYIIDITTCMHKMLYQKEIAIRVWRCNTCLEVQLTIRMSHPALTQKIDIIDSRAVTGYVERPHMTCSLSYECKYTQNAISKSGCSACLAS